MIEGKEVTIRPYRRAFTRPLKAAWGTWSVREGLLLRLRDPATGADAFGEVAPLENHLWKSLPAIDSLTTRESFNTHPCTAFALWSAQTALEGERDFPPPVRTAALLTLDHNTGAIIPKLRDSGVRTFKLKLGTGSPDDEWTNLQSIVLNLKPGEQLRLDPNRTWKKEDWKFWKPRLNGLVNFIQFIEEPFVKGMSHDKLLRKAEKSPVPIALDESLLEHPIRNWMKEDWPGFLVVKPSLMGGPGDWIELAEAAPERVVISSTFETGIGMNTLVHLAARFPGIDHGLGTQAYFDDEFGTHEIDNQIHPLDKGNQERIWENLPAK